jgi:ubiquinone/menaquinone biosynthesis C-methylase UbiE
VALALTRGYADQLPYPDAGFDRVLSSLMFHHLDAQTHEAALRETLRVLRPGGSLHLMDIAGDGHHLHGLARIARRSRRPTDHEDDRIPTLMREAGFVDAAMTGELDRHVGRLAYYRAIRP